VNSSDQLCADIELRLIDGPPAAEDPALAAHLRTCLRCFRTASELREVPQLAALLRQGQERQEYQEDGDQPDPGELFWARFPKTVADAWERRRQLPAPTRLPVWRRVGGLFRSPLPSALAGAAVAAVLVLALVRRENPRPAGPVAAPAAVATIAETAIEDEGPASLLGDDDPLDALALADPKVVARMTARGEAEVPGVDEGVDLGPSPAEELESLETDDLRAVAQALRGRSQI
jgi:hypothetical protein